MSAHPDHYLAYVLGEGAESESVRVARESHRVLERTQANIEAVRKMTAAQRRAAFSPTAYDPNASPGERRFAAEIAGIDLEAPVDPAASQRQLAATMSAIDNLGKPAIPKPPSDTKH